MRRWLSLIAGPVLALAMAAPPAVAQHEQDVDRDGRADAHAPARSHIEAPAHAADGAAGAEHGAAGEEEDVGSVVLAHLSHHLVDSPTYDVFGYTLALPVIPGDFSLLGERYSHGFQVTKHMIGLLLAALLVIVLLTTGTKRTRRGEVPKGFGNFLEVLVVFIRDEVVYNNMGREKGRAWLPFFLTLFFLILFANLLGMVPWGTTATGNVNFTLGLAVANLGAVFIAGFRENGIKYLATFIPHGTPWYVAWLLFPIEVFGLFVKHFALTIRLFANMLAGHTVIGVFIALIAMPLIALAAVPGATAISLLEILVAFIQAYVFVMLGSIFVGMAVHPH